MHPSTDSEKNEPRPIAAPTVDAIGQLANQLLIMKRHHQGAEKAIDKALDILQEMSRKT